MRSTRDPIVVGTRTSPKMFAEESDWVIQLPKKDHGCHSGKICGSRQGGQFEIGGSQTSRFQLQVKSGSFQKDLKFGKINSPVACQPQEGDSWFRWVGVCQHYQQPSGRSPGVAGEHPSCSIQPGWIQFVGHVKDQEKAVELKKLERELLSKNAAGQGENRSEQEKQRRGGERSISRTSSRSRCYLKSRRRTRVVTRKNKGGGTSLFSPGLIAKLSPNLIICSNLLWIWTFHGGIYSFATYILPFTPSKMTPLRSTDEAMRRQWLWSLYLVWQTQSQYQGLLQFPVKPNYGQGKVRRTEEFRGGDGTSLAGPRIVSCHIWVFKPFQLLEQCCRKLKPAW